MGVKGVKWKQSFRIQSLFSQSSFQHFYSILVIFNLIYSGKGDRSRCLSVDSSCGECIKQGPECAWCTDISFIGKNRCDLPSKLSGCDPSKIFHPKSTIQKLQNEELGGEKQHQPKTIVQIQPQQVKVILKPGEKKSFSLDYLSMASAPSNIVALNSETSSSGLQIDYSVQCKGRQIPGRRCNEVSKNDKVSFNVSLTLQECKAKGDVVVSIGISGLRDVVAVYVTAICGCQCEKLSERIRRASECGGNGDLVCGACMCNEGFKGPKCNCRTDMIGAANVDDQQCRKGPGEQICSGRGQCDCGQCKCDHDSISGMYCECSDQTCKMFNGKLCGGHGQCRCGVCHCESGWQGAACDCTTDTSHCYDKNGMICGGHGDCICAECECRAGYSGPYCGQSMYQQPDQNEGDEADEPEYDLSEPNQTEMATEPNDDDPDYSPDYQETKEPEYQESAGINDSGTLKPGAATAAMSLLLFLLLSVFRQKS